MLQSKKKGSLLMTAINLLENWKQKILELYPHAEIRIEVGDENYFFDIECVGPILTVEYRPGTGAGFYAEDAEYGEGPVEVVKDPDMAFARILSLLSKREKSEHESGEAELHRQPAMVVSEK